ncbi:MAG: hypothetical protein PUC50_06840 [Bacteroidales bacterium]|nr:hypothetical protein [Bacteroidales bacterium]
MQKHKTPTPDTLMAETKQQYQKPDIKVITLTNQPSLLSGSGIGGNRKGYGDGQSQNW